MNKTVNFDASNFQSKSPKEIIIFVYNSLKEKGYKPIKQISGYIMSGDPSYITAHNDSRSIIQKFERDEILEELLSFYVENNLES